MPGPFFWGLPDHVTDGGFEPNPLAPAASERSAVPLTWVTQQYAETLLEPRARIRSTDQSY